jgi:hypothetical protein
MDTIYNVPKGNKNYNEIKKIILTPGKHLKDEKKRRQNLCELRFDEDHIYDPSENVYKKYNTSFQYYSKRPFQFKDCIKHDAKAVPDKDQRLYKEVYNKHQCDKVKGIWSDKSLNRDNIIDEGVCWIRPSDAECANKYQNKNLLDYGKTKNTNLLYTEEANYQKRCNENPACEWNNDKKDCYSQESIEYTSEMIIPQLPKDWPVDITKFDIQKYLVQYYSKMLDAYPQRYMPIIGTGNRCTSATGFKISQPQTVINMIMKGMAKSVTNRGLLVWHSTGSGKCHSKDTPILMYDGSIKMVQDIQIGDKLMGDDSTPRKVLSLARGEDEMYDIIPVKGDKYTVNSEHILCLKHTHKECVSIVKKQKNFPYQATHIDNKEVKLKTKSFATKQEAQEYMRTFKEEDKIVEISVKDYLNIAKHLKTKLKGYRKGVEFPSKVVDFDPYIIGLWIGDGSQRDPVITNQDSTIIYYLKKEFGKYNLILNYQSGYDYRISSNIPKGDNILLKTLQKYNMINNKHIPDIYKCNDRNTRLAVLAGIIDSDGYLGKNVYDIIQKSKIIADDIIYICRSLGFAAYYNKCNKSCVFNGKKYTGEYYRISLSGEGLEHIPCKVPRKKAHIRLQIKDALVTGIQVKHVGKGDYYGFTLDGNNRYLLGDFTVTHNTCTAAAVMEAYWDTNKNIVFASSVEAIASNPPDTFIECCVRLMPRFKDNRDKSFKEQMDIARVMFEKRGIKFMTFAQLCHYAFIANPLKVPKEKEEYHKNFLNNTILIIDEVQNIFKPLPTQRKEHDALRKFLADYNNKYTRNLQMVILSATPGESPEEVIDLLNMIRDKNASLIKKPDFSDPVQVNSFAKSVRGLVSFFEISSDLTKFPKVIKNDPYVLPMSMQQYRKYVEAFKDLAPENKDFEKLQKEDKTEKYYRGPRKYANMLYDFETNMTLYEFSSKIPALLDNIKKYPDEKHYIYSVYHENLGFGGQGARAIAKILEKELGYQRMDFKEARSLNNADKLPDKRKRYALAITNELSSKGNTIGENLKELTKLYNRAENKNGDYIHVFLASQGFSTGTDYKGIRHVHIFEPTLSPNKETQIIGRSSRYCSHSHLDYPQQWTSTIHRYLSDFPIEIKKWNIDEMRKILNNFQEELVEKEKQLIAIKGKKGVSELRENLKKDISGIKEHISENKKELKEYEFLDPSKVEMIDLKITEESKAKIRDLMLLNTILKQTSIDCILFKEFHAQSGQQYKCWES